MRPQGRLDNTRRYLRSHWPAFFGLYGLLVLTVVLLGVGLASGWYALIPFALAVMLVAGYVLAGALWTAYQTYDGPGPQIIAQLIDYAQLRPDDKIVCIDLGLRATAVEVARRLITGQVTTIDVYNPQSNPGAPLRRARAAYEGRVVPGAVTAVTETGRREITAAFGVVRFRAGTTVMVEDPAAHTSVPARVEHVAVAADGNVTLTVGPLGRYRVKDFAKVTAGTAVVVSPDTVNVSRDTTSVINAVRRLKSGSWVHHPKRRAPRISRDVPLDVLVAAADTGTG